MQTPYDCQNKVIFEGKAENISKIRAECFKNNCFDFNSIVLMPSSDELTETNWYSWCSKNWGTRSGPYDCYLNDNLTQIECYFKTPWCPPHKKFIQIISEKYPKINIYWYFYEKNNRIVGKYEYNRGEYINTPVPVQEWVYEYSTTKYKELTNMFAEIIEAYKKDTHCQKYDSYGFKNDKILNI